jgi:hypothetical protein
MSLVSNRVWSGDPVRWLSYRLGVYLLVAVIVLQAAAGFAGFGEGGEWMIAAAVCEAFFACWFAREWARPYRHNGEARKTTALPAARDLLIAASNFGMMSALEERFSAIESRAIRGLLGTIGRDGKSFIMNETSREVVGVLLSRDEYELLNAAASVASDPEHMARLLDEPPATVLSYDAAFGGEGA